MNEEDWFKCGDPLPMLYHLRGPGDSDVSSWTMGHSSHYGQFTLASGPSTQISGRKCHLYAAACIRRYGYLVEDRDCLVVATRLELLADALEDLKDVNAAYAEFRHRTPRHPAGRSSVAVSFAQFLFLPVDACTAGRNARDVAVMVAWAKAGESVNKKWPNPDEETHMAWSFGGGPPDDYWQESLRGETKRLAHLLRHIVGNPFRPYPAPPYWPTTIVQLAQSMYDGEQSHAFALHDALLEAGHPDLAEHFRGEEWHPKGCWVLDIILGKK